MMITAKDVYEQERVKSILKLEGYFNQRRVLDGKILQLEQRIRAADTEALRRKLIVRRPDVIPSSSTLRQ